MSWFNILSSKITKRDVQAGLQRYKTNKPKKRQLFNKETVNRWMK